MNYNLNCDICGCDFGSDQPHRGFCPDRPTTFQDRLDAFYASRACYVVIAGIFAAGCVLGWLACNP